MLVWRKLLESFDAASAAWESERAARWLSNVLLIAFVGSIAWIELARNGYATTFLGRPMPTNHLAAISWVVTLLLISEILDLIFGLARSVANALGKQLEIFSLILLRKSLDELPTFGEPVVVGDHQTALLHMAADSAGALVVFAVVIVYYRLQRHRPISGEATVVERFVAQKKVICLAMLGAFVVSGIYAGFASLTLAPGQDELELDFFEAFFTALIFADIAIVLASLGATKGYQVIFRNFAFATVTVFLRLALSAEPYLNSLLGVGAALFALATSWVAGLAPAERTEGRAEGRDGE